MPEGPVAHTETSFGGAKSCKRRFARRRASARETSLHLTATRATLAACRARGDACRWRPEAGCNGSRGRRPCNYAARPGPSAAHVAAAFERAAVAGARSHAEQGPGSAAAGGPEFGRGGQCCIPQSVVVPVSHWAVGILPQETNDPEQAMISINAVRAAWTAR